MVGATGFEPATTCTPTEDPSRPTITSHHQPCVITGDESGAAVQPSQGSGTLHRNFAANVLPPPSSIPHALASGTERLLTVRQVAARLGVCAATVYKWTADGTLPHVRIVNVIRFRPADLAAIIARTAP